MKITILAVGKLRERFFTEAVAEYSKRLSKYCTLEILQVADEKTPDGAGEAVNEQIREKEGARLLAKIKETSFVITLEINGNRLDSVELADMLQEKMVHAESSLVFVIGGSLGLSEAVRRRSDYALSFSKMTFPHQLMRVILLEQLYRSFKILKGEPYHK